MLSTRLLHKSSKWIRQRQPKRFMSRYEPLMPFFARQDIRRLQTWDKFKSLFRCLNPFEKKIDDNVFKFSYLTLKASTFIQLIYRYSIELDDKATVMVIYDTHSTLARVLATAYCTSHPNVEKIDFDDHTATDIIRMIDDLRPKDLVVVVQSKSFRLNEYRLRIELFKKRIKTIEHHYLSMMPDNQVNTYIESLALIPSERVIELAHGLKKRIDTSSKTIVRCLGGTECVYETPMEPTLLNIGHYEAMRNVGGNFPVGEVFSEPTHLEGVNGEMMVWGFPDENFVVRIVEPFKIKIVKGHVVEVGENAPESFMNVYNGAMKEEGFEAENGIMVREFGLGLNKAMSKDKPVNNITAFERQQGLHISLGRKHTVYKKEGISAKKSRYHIDLFIDVQEIIMDDFSIYKEGEYHY